MTTKQPNMVVKIFKKRKMVKQHRTTFVVTNYTQRATLYMKAQ